jgi:glutathione peroxidase
MLAKEIDMRHWVLVPIMLVGLGCSSETPEPVDAARGTSHDASDAGEVETTAAQPEVPVEMDMLDVSMNRIDGTPESLEAYRGKVVMVVNVASKCGLTPQYEQLVAMYEKYKDQGFVVLGFPANDFRGQEPGTNDEILEFCTQEYGVDFPMFEKIVVTGDDAHPFYKTLTEKSEAPSWNFTKYLIDRNGKFVERIEPKTTPDDPKVVERVESLLNG